MMKVARTGEQDYFQIQSIWHKGFHKAHIRAFVYSSCDVYCNKMRTFALYGIQPTCAYGKFMPIGNVIILTNYYNLRII